MSGCCLAAIDGLPVVPSLAFAVVSLVLARHWAGGSLNDGYVTKGYRLRLLEQILIIWGIVEFNAPAPASGETSIPLCDRDLRVRCARHAIDRNP